ncbi:hypothetical protein BH11MYX2_BH11MYX2_34880 [soil metagenome]
MRILSSLLLVAALPTVALADPTDQAPALTANAPAKVYELGVRIGGYGFRREGDARPGNGWTECRMNGLGVFGTRTISGPLYVEAGLDMYSTAGTTHDDMDLPLDRTSGLISAAIGARTNIAWWLRGYVQLGAGVELTKLSVPYGDETIRDNKAMPEGFFGAGMDLRIMKDTYVGATVRTLMMGNFDYDPKRLDPNGGWVSAPAAGDVFNASTGVAMQAQFYVRRAL